MSNTTGEAGAFEGKYQVGDRICTVKPAKMVFEVKCGKETEAEKFFYQGNSADTQFFEADVGEGRTEAFTFDNENYDTGTFRRADGKESAVKRIK